jgi:hypothetical protein
MSDTIILKESTASQVRWLGPFVDETDGDSPETALTIANTDIQIAKHAATSFSSKNSGGATHAADGMYYATFDATDTNTVGAGGRIYVNEAGALIWSSPFIVLAANVYDAMYGDGVLAAPTALPVLGTDTWPEIIAWIGAVAGGLHELRQTSALWSVYNAASSATIATATVSDSGTEFRRQKLA